MSTIFDELIREACLTALREMSPEEVKSLSFVRGCPVPAMEEELAEAA